MKYSLFIFCLFILMCQSMEENTTESRPLAEDTMATTIVSLTNSSKMVEESHSTGHSGKKADGTERSANGRMLSLHQLFTSTSTVKPTPYDYWWYFTTPRRPLISYRDYPGKPGVATWKEISPLAEKESRKGKTVDPTAAGVSSSATWWINRTYLFSLLTVVTLVQFMTHLPS